MLPVFYHTFNVFNFVSVDLDSDDEEDEIMPSEVIEFLWGEKFTYLNIPSELEINSNCQESVTPCICFTIIA